MPLNIDFFQVLLHMLNFVILAGSLGFLLFDPVTKFMNNRQKQFADMAKENEEAAKANAELKAEYEQKFESTKVEVADMLRQAETDAANTAREYIDDARKKAAAIISNAETEAEKRKKAILDSTQSEISELVLSATEKLLSDAATPERDSALYDEFIRRSDKAVADKRNA